MEIWATVENFTNYKISNLGRVKNVRTNTIKKLDYSRAYAQVSLYNKGQNKKFLIHRLVATAFCSNPKNKNFVNHIDGNKLNNHANNLEWVTASENMVHAFSNSLIDFNIGEECSWAKLNEKQVLKIVEMFQNGQSQTQLAKLFKVTRSAIYRLLTGKNWKHLKLAKYSKIDTKKRIVDQYGNEYESISFAAKSINASIGNVSSVLSGRRKSTKGYFFTYKK